jgi:hypothetical protein
MVILHQLEENFITAACQQACLHYFNVNPPPTVHTTVCALGNNNSLT